MRNLGALALTLCLAGCGTGGQDAVVEFADVPDVAGQRCPGEEKGGTIHDYPQGAFDFPGAPTTAREAVTRYVEKVADAENKREFVGATFVQSGKGPRLTFTAVNDDGEVRGAIGVERGGDAGAWLVTSDWTCQGAPTGRPLVTRGMNTATPTPAANPDAHFSGPGS
jgi:hypothetical protein